MERTLLPGRLHRSTCERAVKTLRLLCTCWGCFFGLAFLNLLSADLSHAGHAPALIQLSDQYDTNQVLCFPTNRVTVLTIADRHGSEQIDGWISPLKQRFVGRIYIRGIADVAGVPGIFRSHIRKRFQESRKYPVMMDWSGKTVSAFAAQTGGANVYVIAPDGAILLHVFGPATKGPLGQVEAVIERTLTESSAQNHNHPNPATGS